MENARTPLRSLSIGGATYDIFVTLKDTVENAKHELVFPAGSKTHIRNVIEACGGGAANTSVGLSRLGCTASFCGVLGADQWGEKMLQNLQKEKVKTDSATIVEGETSSFSIILSTGHDRSILTAPGVSEHLHDVTFDANAMMNADVIYLNHLSETACVIENDIVRMLKGFAGHLTWNPGGCQIEAGMHAHDKTELLKMTSLLLVNMEEVLQFTGCKTMDEAISALRTAGVKCVMVTDGKNGVTAEDETGRYHCPVAETTVVDTTGAGDAFGTGATWALAQGMSLQKALIAGTLNAAKVVSAIGSETALLHEDEMHTLLSSTDLEVTRL